MPDERLADSLTVQELDMTTVCRGMTPGLATAWFRFRLANGPWRWILSAVLFCSFAGFLGFRHTFSCFYSVPIGAAFLVATIPWTRHAIGSTRIRKATEADLSVMQDIAKRTIDQCYRPFVGDEGVDWYITSGESDRELEENIGNCEVLTKDGNIVAFAIYFGNLIHLLMVDVSRHRTGIGSQLLAHSEKRLSERGNTTLRVETFEGNDQAISFYVKHGWVIAKKVEDKEHGFNRVFFQKQVSGSPAHRMAHILALFLKWCFKKGRAGGFHRQEEPEDMEKVIEEALSGTDSFSRYWDGRLANKEVNAFAEQYYGENGLYLDDYSKEFIDHLYGEGTVLQGGPVSAWRRLAARRTFREAERSQAC